MEPVNFSAKVGERLLEVSVERHNGEFHVEVDGKSYVVDAQKLEGSIYSILTDDRSYEVSVEVERDTYRIRHRAVEQTVTITDPSRRARETRGAETDGPQKISTMMPGKVVRILVAAGDEVEEGQGVVVVEAMKMENEIAAPRAGRVREVVVAPDQTVETGAILVVIE